MKTKSNKRTETPGDETVMLRVAEAQARDGGRGLARIDPQVLEALGARVGDVVGLEGKRTAFCRAMPSLPDQRGLGTVQVDGVTRLNSGVGLGERVSLRRFEPPTAERIELTVEDGGDTAIPAHLFDGLAVSPGDRVRLPLFGSRMRELRVERTRPAGPVLVVRSTRVGISGGRESTAPARSRGVSYEDVGGLSREIRRVREMVELPLRYPQVFARLGIDAPKGILLSGPPGTGKTLIARAVASETQAAFFTISGPEVIHKFYGESEARLREIFESASKAAPAIVFLDEIESLAPKRDRVQGDVEKRVVSQLLALMDGLRDRGQVMVIAATNLPDLLDPALRRPGRFDRELTIGVPDESGRREILEIHTRGMPLAEDVQLDELARWTPGYVGADLAALCREAAMAVLRKSMPELELDSGFSEEQLAVMTVDREAFQAGLAEVGPSAIRELVVEVPNVSWDQVGGLVEAKARLREAIEWPLRYAPLFRKAGCRAARGILLVGEPGTGKTLLARAAATSCGCNFLSVKGPELLSRYVGDSERAVREFFRKVRQSAPCLVFLDELDSMAPSRSALASDSGVSARVVAQILTEMDGIEEINGVLVLAATNRADLVDAALLRPGRFDLVIHLERPDVEGCEQILRIHSAGRPLSRDVDLKALARAASGLTAAEIAWACQQAALAAIAELVETAGEHPDPARLVLEPRHFMVALEAFGERAALVKEGGGRHEACPRAPR